MSNNNNEKAHYQVMMGSYTVEDFVNKIDDAYDEKKRDEDGTLGRPTKKGILIAHFQRTYQWHTKEHPKNFLDSLNRNIFVMPVILVEHDRETWIIDGQQRLATLYCYVKGFTPKDDEPIEWKNLIVAIKREDLNVVKPCEWTEFDGAEFDMEDIKQTPIGYSFLFNVDHKDNKELLLQIFDRINNQGMQLTKAETIRAYGWLYPRVQSFIDLIDNATYEYTLDYLSDIMQEKSKENKILNYIFVSLLSIIYQLHIKDFDMAHYLDLKKNIEILILDEDSYDKCKIIIEHFINNSVICFDFANKNKDVGVKNREYPHFCESCSLLDYFCKAIVKYAFNHENQLPQQETLHKLKYHVYNEIPSGKTNAYNFLEELMTNE